MSLFRFSWLKSKVESIWSSTLAKFMSASDFFDLGVIVAVLHVRAVPVDETTCPLDRTLAVGR